MSDGGNGICYDPRSQAGARARDYQVFDQSTICDALKA